MEQNNVIRQFDTLPPEAQRQVIDFIEFLQTRYRPATQGKIRTKVKLADEKFIGIWRNRVDMKDSSAWVRDIRANEWGNAL